MKKPTQQERVLKALLDAKGGWVSTRHFKQVMLISEVNGRLSELKARGYEIETSDFTDEYGFRSHRIKLPDPATIPLI